MLLKVKIGDSTNNEYTRYYLEVYEKSFNFSIVSIFLE